MANEQYYYAHEQNEKQQNMLENKRQTKNELNIFKRKSLLTHTLTHIYVLHRDLSMCVYKFCWRFTLWRTSILPLMAATPTRLASPRLTTHRHAIPKQRLPIYKRQLCSTNSTSLTNALWRVATSAVDQTKYVGLNHWHIIFEK